MPESQPGPIEDVPAHEESLSVSLSLSRFGLHDSFVTEIIYRSAAPPPCGGAPPPARCAHDGRGGVGGGGVGALIYSLSLPLSLSPSLSPSLAPSHSDLRAGGARQRPRPVGQSTGPVVQGASARPR